MSLCKHFEAVDTTEIGNCRVGYKGIGVKVSGCVCAKCPIYAGPMRGLGDVVHSVAGPVARAMKSDCHDQLTNKLKEESPCNKRRTQWNERVPLKGSA